jgi:YesN/AraC family two-component response regulator
VVWQRWRGGILFYKVIMVDDENFALDNVAMHFNWESMGFNLSGKFNDAQSALTYLQNNQVDIVITDIRMPKMSGIELAEVIQRQYSHIVVVFLSAYSEFEYARSALQFNVADYLVKPITLESLSDLCRTIYKKLAGKDAHSLVHQEAIPFQLQKALSNYFTNQSTDISELMKAVEESGETSELIGLPSTILSLHIEDLDEYLLHTWRQGKESFFAHNYQLSGATNQKLILKNCKGVSKYGYAIKLEDANNESGGASDNIDTVFSFYNNMFYSEELGKTNITNFTPSMGAGDIGYIKISGDSFGNNISQLNK